MGGAARDPEKLRLRRKRSRCSERGQARARRQASERRSALHFINILRVLMNYDPIAPYHPRNRNAS